VPWQNKTYTINSTSPVTLKWRFVRDESGGSNTDCGFVDFLRYSGTTASTPPDIRDWETAVNYKYDTSGRRIKKKVDNYTIRYIYDGGNVIGEYDINDNLLRKYIHGARVDELVCMIDVADSNAVYYYHYDGLGSVVASSDSSGDSCQSYEYSVFGQVVAEDPNHPNPYLFTGRRFDIETGLYYYRARYYNPYIGRFLQTDPVGYSAGMNLYRYCRNNPLGLTDPSGCDPCDPCNYDMNDYKCVGWIVVPMNIDPYSLQLAFDIKHNSFKAAKNVVQLLFIGDKTPAASVSFDFVFNPIAELASDVMIEQLRCFKNESAGYCKAYLVIMKKKRHWIFWTRLDDDNPIYLEVQGGDGWEEGLGGYYPREKAEAAAKKAAEEWGYYGDAYDIEEAMTPKVIEAEN